MSEIVVAPDTTATKLIKIYEMDLMQADKDNFKKTQINGFRKLSEDEVRKLQMEICDSGKLAYLLMKSEGNRPFDLKMWCIRNPTDCGQIVDEDGQQVTLIDEIKIEQLNKLATFSGGDNEKTAKLDAQLKIITGEDGNPIVKYGDKPMIIYDDIAKEASLKIKVFDKILNESQAAEKALEKKTNQLKEINEALSLAENEEDKQQLKSMIDVITIGTAILFEDVFSKYLIDKILECDKKMAWEDMSTAGQFEESYRFKELSFITMIKSSKSKFSITIKNKIKSRKSNCENATDKFLCEQALEEGLDNLTNPKYKTAENLEEEGKIDAKNKKEEGKIKLEQKKRALTNPTTDTDQSAQSEQNEPVPNNTVFEKIIDTQQTEADKVKDNFPM